MKITREQLRRWGACYDDVSIAALVPEDGLAPLEIAALPIPVEDRLWVLLHEEVIPARDLRMLACDWAEAACHAAGWSDVRSLAAIEVSRRFAVGEASKAELAEAEADASASASSAWSAASASAAWSAACAAAEAAWSSAMVVAMAGRAKKARSAQLVDVVRVIRG